MSADSALVSVLLAAAGIVAGFVDSIAGGGGLITLPSISLVLGPGATAIGTNKICGFAAAAVALFVYARGGHFDWRRGAAFTAAVGVGAILGSRIAPRLPPEIFPWFLAVTCPVILYIVWRKDLWIAREDHHASPSGAATGWWQPTVFPTVLLAGLACGFYDGLWGPGGGTFMFLSLLFAARMPLLGALAASKLANAVSALAALGSYALQGHVHVREGALVAAGAVVGGFVGARLASARASRIVRPVLACVVTILAVKTFVSR
jgi:uncharacterized membrane protein YfcA